MTINLDALSTSELEEIALQSRPGDALLGEVVRELELREQLEQDCE